MFLSDRTMKERLTSGSIVIDPLDWDAIQPASIDLRLSPEIRYPGPPNGIGRYPWPPIPQGPVPLPFWLEPGGFMLACTNEHIKIPDDLVARIEGKSSFGRQGVQIHLTAGWIDPGWNGKITLELVNHSKYPFRLDPLMKFCQITFCQMTTPADRPYGSEGLGSRYQGSEKAEPSR